MPRIVRFDPAVASRIDRAVKAIQVETPKDPTLRKRAAKGRLRLNFDTVSIESGVARHLFDKSKSVYPQQHAAIVGLMPAKGESEPLAHQLTRIRDELDKTVEQLERSRTYAAHVLTWAHQLELEVARLKEEVAMLAGGDDDMPLVGSGQLLGLPPPQRRRMGPGQGRGKKRASGG